MARFFKNRQAAFGQAPVTPVFIGSKKVETPKIQYFLYAEDSFEESPLLDKIPENRDGWKDKTLWVNVVGLHDPAYIAAVCAEFGVHELIPASIVNTGMRPRMTEFDDEAYFSLKMMRFVEDKKVIQSEQISMVLKENLILTFQEEPGDVFEPVRERLRQGKGRIRKFKSDYLTFALMDLIFDHYSYAVEQFGEEIEDLEESILHDPTEGLLEQINGFKRELNFLRKNIKPAREVATAFAKMESPIIQKHTRQFLKELTPSVVQAIEVVESYSNMLSDFLGVYHSAISNKANDVMKVLTIFAAIFIPLTFAAGIYGMNFEYIPELQFKYSYPIFWGVLITITFFMLRYFKRKKWL